jgi:adenylate cyclase
MGKVLLVVSREAPALLERFAREFRDVEAVTVIVDRRVGERRRRVDVRGAERRRRDRRRPGPADHRLSLEGWTLTDARPATDPAALPAAGAPVTDPRKVTELLEAIQMLSRELNLTRLLQLIMDKASRLLNADRASLFVVDERRGELWSKVAQGLEVREIRVPIGEGIAGGVAATGERVNIADAYNDPRFNPEVDRRTGYRTRAILCAPVRDAGGRVVAVVQLLNRRDGAAFDADDERLLEAFVGQVAIALRNAQQMEQIEQRRKTSELLLDVMKSFSSELEVDGLLRKIMERTSAVLQAERSTLFLVDGKTREIWSKVAQGGDMVEIRVPIGRGIAGAVAATGETINIPDAYADPRFNQEVDRRTGYRTRTVLCAPVHDAQGAIVGVAQVLNKAGGPFTADDEELLAALSAQAFIALDNARLFESVVTMKNYNDSILACMATGVMTLDRDGLVTSVNPAFRRIFGAPDRAAGCSVRELLDVKLNEPFVVGLDACARAGLPHQDYELKYALGPDESVNVNVSVVPLLDSKRQPLGVVVVAEDITQEQRLMSTLCRYVTREIAEEVMKQKGRLRLGGTRQPVSILFADIRNFTAISERHEPETIVEFLNDYFAVMVQEIFAEHGTLDKFMGDGIMAVFGAPISRPDDPVRAVRAALGMRRSLRGFNERQRARGGVEIEIGIGISHGESISGNVGSEQRMEYTVIGDSVNLAARLEGLTKNHPYKILINDRIYEQVKDRFECVLLGEERVKGKAQPVQVYGIPDAGGA